MSERGALFGKTAGQVEVDQRGLPGGTGHQDIGWVDIAVHDTVAVNIGDDTGERERQFDFLTHGQQLSVQHLGERNAGDVFQHEHSCFDSGGHEMRNSSHQGQAFQHGLLVPHPNCRVGPEQFLAHDGSAIVAQATSYDSRAFTVVQHVVTHSCREQCSGGDPTGKCGH